MNYEPGMYLAAKFHDHTSSNGDLVLGRVVRVERKAGGASLVHCKNLETGRDSVKASHVLAQRNIVIPEEVAKAAQVALRTSLNRGVWRETVVRMVTSAPSESLFAPERKSKGSAEALDPVGEKSVLLRLDVLRPSPYQPDSRLSDEALKTLKADIKADIAAHGNIRFPIQVLKCTDRDNAYYIFNGHRRFAVVRMLGLDQIRANVTVGLFGELKDLFRTANDARRVSAFEWMESWYKGGHVPRHALRAIAERADIFGGRSGIRYLLDARVAPTIRTDIKRCKRLLDAYPNSVPAIPFGQIGRWIVDHKLQGEVHGFLGEALGAAAARRLASAIEANEPRKLISARGDRSLRRGSP